MMKFLSRLTDSNDREVRRLEPIVAEIDALEPQFEALSDAELRAKTDEFKTRLRDELGELLVPIEQREHRSEVADGEISADGVGPVGSAGDNGTGPDDWEGDDSELTASDPTALAERRKEQRKRELKR